MRRVTDRQTYRQMDEQTDVHTGVWTRTELTVIGPRSTDTTTALGFEDVVAYERVLTVGSVKVCKTQRISLVYNIRRLIGHSRR